MRTLMLIFVVLGLAALVSAANEGFSVGNVRPPLPEKPAGEPYTPPPDGPRLQGDTIADPFYIPDLPFSASGMTVGFANDYDAVCPYSGSTSPDVVYKYSPSTETRLAINLCASIYDTKVYVFENTIGNVIACNDDFCAFQSYLGNVRCLAGNTYYIVVDGYGSSSGHYYMDVSLYLCSGSVPCPPGAMPEGEPDCYDGYEDTYNAGCDATPFPVFQTLEPSSDPIVICGTTGVYRTGTDVYRDTDWFEIELTAPANICLGGDSALPCYFFIIDGRGGCANSQIVASAEAGPCWPVSGLCWDCGVGTWWLWAGPRSWDLSYLCGFDYWMEITGYTNPPSPARETTWAGVKALFR